jgi:protein involved in polysaccharide export with SLBB domain
MSSRARTVLLLAGLLAWGPQAARSQQASAYVLQPGDKVTIDVFTSAGARVDVVGGERILDRNGDIYLPYLGTVHASGLDQVSLRDVLVAGFGGFYAEPVVNVKVQLRINITGAVPRPGQYFMDPTATLMDALSQAGGANAEYAVTGSQIPSDPRHVQLVRAGERRTLNFHPAEIAEETLQLVVRSGDWIHVPAQKRTGVRDEVMFWGSLISFVSGVISLVLLVNRG